MTCSVVPGVATPRLRLPAMSITIVTVATEFAVLGALRDSGRSSGGGPLHPPDCVDAARADAAAEAARRRQQPPEKAEALADFPPASS